MLSVQECPTDLGVFTNETIQQGETILLMQGPIICVEQACAKGERECDALQIDSELYIDLNDPGRLVNHSCQPNTGITDRMNLIALRTILPGEEITYDYSTTMDEARWEMRCKCGAAGCRGTVQDFSRLPLELRNRYIQLGIVQPFIAHRLVANRIT